MRLQHDVYAQEQEERLRVGSEVMNFYSYSLNALLRFK
jgi:hypothetical protein